MNLQIKSDKNNNKVFDMSLLSNLLAFSSLNTTGQKQQRSASANSRFFFESDETEKTTEPKHRVASKSLSKMGLLSNTNQSKVDPKYRSLHRVVHNLSMKVRKHYYSLFVTLQTLKKKNLTMNKHQRAICPEKLEAAAAKANQTISIIYLKEYENAYKTQSFLKIKAQATKSHLAKTTVLVSQNAEFRFFGLRLFRYFNHLQKLNMKFDLMETALDPVLKKCNRICLAESFKMIKSSRQQDRQESPKKQEKTVSIFEMFDSMQKKINSSEKKLQTSFESDLNRKSSKVSKSLQSEFKNEQFSTTLEESQPTIPGPNYMQYSNMNTKRQALEQGKQRFSLSNSVYEKSQIFQIPHLSKFSSLQASPAQPRSKAKSPFKICKRVPNLRESVATDTLESRSYQKVYKSYQICLKFDERPFQLPSTYESLPKILPKMGVQELSFPEVEDIADKSNIFRDFKGSKFSSIDSLEISNVVGEPFLRAETLISDIERNRQRFENNSERSQLSYTPYLPNDASMSSINNQRQESNFGCDAVNFKNSLVMERESMKKNQRENQRDKVEINKKKGYIAGELDHQSQQLQNLKNRKKSKNQFSDRKVSQHILPHTFEQSYVLDSDYLIKRDSLSSYQACKVKSGNINLQSTFNGCSWEQKRHHEYNSEGKAKSFSFNSSSVDMIPRRLRFNGVEYDKKTEQESYVPNFYGMSSNGTALRDPLVWKNELIENRSQMPVRDVGLDPFSKIRSKNSSNAQSQIHIGKEAVLATKKFISISKR